MSKPIPVALQLYSVREQAKTDVLGTLKKVASYGYRGVELAGDYGKKPAELRKVFDDLGLEVMSTHSALPSPENRAQILDAAQALGNKFHISGFGADQFATKEKTLETARRFQQAAEVLKGTALSYGFHNHWWEFASRFDGKTAEELALEAAPDAFAQVDTYWCAVGGSDPAEFVRKHGKRTPLLHIKDGPAERGKPMTAVGDGKMKWAPVMKAAQAAGVQWLVVELDSCSTDMLVAVERSVKYLVDQGYGAGR